jgi:hypothetical protein
MTDHGDAGRYPVEVLDEYDDDGTMPGNVDTLAAAVVGRRIVSATKATVPGRWYGEEEVTLLTLDDGKQVILADSSDCCAYTEMREFFLDPSKVDHMILGVGTTDGYTTWHIYADLGDVMQLKVGWSCGNPFYYGYGFDIRVLPQPEGESNGQG